VPGTDLFENQGALFGHLVSRFSTHPENLATEALAFIVNRSATMREELRILLGRTGIQLPQLARFRSQAGDDQANIPDLIGLDTTGAERLFIENKFWAGLTENQPADTLSGLRRRTAAFSFSLCRAGGLRSYGPSSRVRR
jgi:hypothetical protein